MDNQIVILLAIISLALSTASPYTGGSNSSCSSLISPPKNGFVEKFGENNLIVKCNKGFYPEGNPLITCNETTKLWIAREVACLPKTCSYPGEPIHGKKLGTLFRVNDTVTYECDSCYHLKGDKQRVCMDNETWSGNLPTCEPIDCGPLSNSSFENGKMYGWTTTYGSIMSFYCNTGFTRIGQKRIECQCNGQWNGKMPFCQVEEKKPSKKCKAPSSPVNGYALPVNRKTSYEMGDVVKYFCILQYELIGSNNRTCQSDGTWSGTKPSCKLAYCDDIEADAPENGKRFGGYRIGDSYNYVCDSGYSIEGNRSIECLPNGQWSAEIPTCKEICASFQCGYGEMCKFNVELNKPTCVCMENLDCPALYDPACGSDGKTYNNECIMKATGCRLGKRIKKVADGNCIPGGICNIKPVSKCRGYFEVFYYNKESRKCEQIVVGGCHRSGWNGFETLSDCQQTCINSFCQRPAERGPCLSFRQQWYFDAETGDCRTFQYGGCFGNQNNFDTKVDCMNYCNPGRTTVIPSEAPEMKTVPTSETKTAPTSETKIVPTSETKTCPPCQKPKKSLCDVLKSNDFAIIGKVSQRSASYFKIRVDRAIKDTRGYFTPIGSHAQVYILGDPVCRCPLVIPKGIIVFSSSFTQLGNEIVPVIHGGYLAQRFYGEKQLRC